mmetsp:Transcript_1856/g.2519  ORF Transcript_1856/g.2519 Transcript_1856/m.2519 type:complete len:126 (-) Transcript_1856:107-484(-)
MGVFFRFFHTSTSQRFPNLATFLMKARERPPVKNDKGMSSLLSFDISRFQEYVRRPLELQYSNLSLTYCSRQREVSETTSSGKPLFVPMPKWACDRYELVDNEAASSLKQEAPTLQVKQTEGKAT